jgi:predicted lipoprotein with Yx(FWY)xxD motif
MKRTHTLLAGVLAGAASGLAIAGPTIASAQGGAPQARAAGAAKVELRHTRLGSILVSASGFTVYDFTRDRGEEDSCVKIHGCTKAWPPLETSGTPVAGPGVRSSLLSSIRLPNGARQVTYAGHALYTYAGDSSPGETSYVGVNAFGGDWDALNAAGHQLA